MSEVEQIKAQLREHGFEDNGDGTWVRKQVVLCSNCFSRPAVRGHKRCADCGVERHA